MPRIAEHTDEEWARAAHAGDTRASFELDRCWRHRLTGLARTILKPSGLESEAEDCAQEALWRAVLHIERFRKGALFEAWILAIGSNIALDVLRARKRQTRALGQLDRDNSAVQSSESVVEREEEMSSLRQCLKGLKERSRRVIALIYEMGFSLAQAGQVLGKPKTTVQSWHDQAREQLHRCMEEKGF